MNGNHGSTRYTYLEKLGVERIGGKPGCTVSILDGDVGGAVVPVVATNNDGLASDVVAAETEVVTVERAVNIDNLAEMVGDAAVEAN